jgi:hypothetical protein
MEPDEPDPSSFFFLPKAHHYSIAYSNLPPAAPCSESSAYSWFCTTLSLPMMSLMVSCSK